MAGPLPWLPRPRDCVSCGLCAAICPAGARGECARPTYKKREARVTAGLSGHLFASRSHFSGGAFLAFFVSVVPTFGDSPISFAFWSAVRILSRLEALLGLQVVHLLLQLVRLRAVLRLHGVDLRHLIL